MRLRGKVPVATCHPECNPERTPQGVSPRYAESQMHFLTNPQTLYQHDLPCKFHAFLKKCKIFPNIRPICRGSFTTRRQSRRCRSLLDKLKRDQAQALQQHRFPATTCPICMEDIQTPRGTPRFDEAGPSHSVHVNPDSSSSDHQAEGSSHADGDPSRAAGGSSSPSAPLLDGGTSKEDRSARLLHTRMLISSPELLDVP